MKFLEQFKNIEMKNVNLVRLPNISFVNTQIASKESELRKKQYEYYRDLLLTFPKHNIEL
jgi:restriction endonuclease S subunit